MDAREKLDRRSLGLSPCDFNVSPSLERSIWDFSGIGSRGIGIGTSA